jgi:hypothetical protein
MIKSITTSRTMTGAPTETKCQNMCAALRREVVAAHGMRGVGGGEAGCFSTSRGKRMRWCTHSALPCDVNVNALAL